MFSGAMTAMVSPFKSGKLDEGRLRANIEFSRKDTRANAITFCSTKRAASWTSNRSPSRRARGRATPIRWWIARDMRRALLNARIRAAAFW